MFGSEQPRIDFVGVADYDFMEIYRQYTYHSMANYRLDTVAEYEVGANKLHHDGSFQDFYKNNWEKFIAYNIRDTVLVKEIDDATDLLSVAVSVSQMCGVNLQDTFGTVKKLDALTYQYVSARNMIVPPNKRNETETFPGGFVAEPAVGRHFAVVSVDAASLYPSMIRESNISPETQVPYDSLPEDIQNLMDTITVEKAWRDEVDYSCLEGTPYLVTPAGVCYDQTTKGIVPEIMESLYIGRKQAKKRSIDHKKNYLAAKEEIERRGLVI
jgi:DNA polymerase elongation subunit (family B)